MATLKDLVKTQRLRKLTEEKASKLVEVREKSLMKSKELEEFMRDGVGITSPYNIKEKDAINDIARIQSEFSRLLYNHFHKDINAYASLIASLKQEGYNIPGVTEDCAKPVVLVKDDTTFYRVGAGYGYGSIGKKERDIIVRKNPEWISGINEYKEARESDIKDLMDKLGFVIMPLEFLSPLAKTVDKKLSDKDINEKIINFKNAITHVTGKVPELYVLSPIKYLDLMAWAKEKDTTKTVTFAKSLESVSLNINMSIPLFRSLFGSIEMLEQRVEKTEEAIQAQQKLLENNMKSLQNQLGEVRTELITKIRDIAMDQMELDTRVKSLESWRIACETDPLIYAKVGNRCWLGFAWGPDFPASVLEEFGLKVQK